MERPPETRDRPSICPAADGHEENPTADPIIRRREQNRLAQRRFRWKQSQQKAAQRPTVGHDNSYRLPQPRGTPVDAPPPQQLVSPASSSSNDLALVSGACDHSSKDHPMQPNMTPSPSMSWEGLLADETALDLPGPEGFYPLSPSTSDFQVLLGTKNVAIDDRVENGPVVVVNPQLDNGMDRPWPSSVATENADPQYPPLLTITATTASSPRTRADSTTTQPRPRTLPRLIPEKRDESNATVSAPGRGWLGPLHLAAAKGRDRIVRVLLTRQSPDCDINSPDSDGMTALMHAIEGGFDDVAKSLLDAGAVVDQVDNNGRTALHWAVSKRRETLLRQLLQHGTTAGADLNVYNNDGQTPLHSAIDAGFELGVQLLLEFGGDLQCMAQKT